MKYVPIIIFYFCMGVYHVLDIIIRTVFNLFILIWDFKWSTAKLYSYKTVYDFAQKKGEYGKQITLCQLYSTDYHFKINEND